MQRSDFIMSEIKQGIGVIMEIEGEARKVAALYTKERSHVCCSFGDGQRTALLFKVIGRYPAGVIYGLTRPSFRTPGNFRRVRINQKAKT